MTEAPSTWTDAQKVAAIKALHAVRKAQHKAGWDMPPEYGIRKLVEAIIAGSGHEFWPEDWD